VSLSQEARSGGSRDGARAGSWILRFTPALSSNLDQRALLLKERNRLLAALPAAEYESLSFRLQIVELPAQRVLAWPDEEIEYVYFPQNGLVSMLVPMENGKAVEGAMIGNEGIVGLQAFLGDGVAREQLVQISAGRAARLPVSEFREIAKHSWSLQALVTRYAVALMTHMARTAGCNRVHSVDQRLARLLLMITDRTGSDEVALTHDVLAGMLGARRASVTQAAGLMADAGLIDNRRGQLVLRDRLRLEAASCEDYRLSHNAFERMFVEFAAVSANAHAMLSARVASV
jgi:CRP-like cAMP-binding protein